MGVALKVARFMGVNQHFLRGAGNYSLFRKITSILDKVYAMDRLHHQSVWGRVGLEEALGPRFEARPHIDENLGLKGGPHCARGRFKHMWAGPRRD